MVRIAIEVSIIIPSHNRYPLNLLTLYSLDAQGYDMSQVEVILIDDASSDATPSIAANQCFSFQFRYVRLAKNLGRPRARNFGISNSRGTHLIFLDAEVIVPPDFIDSHMRIHRQQSRIIAGGLYAMKKTYTRMDPLFSHEQRLEAEALLRRQPALYEKWLETRHLKDPPCLIGRDEIELGLYRDLSLENPHSTQFANQVLRLYGDWFSGFNLPWITAGTGNLSVERRAFEVHGMFEEYKGWGADDIEMGFRLYTNGYRFVHLSSMPTYHQEHPIQTSISEEGKHNFYLFQQKYRTINLLAILLVFRCGMSYSEASRVLDDVHAISLHEYPHRFMHLINTFRAMLESVGRLSRYGLPIHNLDKQCGYLISSPYERLFHAEKNALEQSGKYLHLNQALDLLLSY